MIVSICYWVLFSIASISFCLTIYIGRMVLYCWLQKSAWLQRDPVYNWVIRQSWWKKRPFHSRSSVEHLGIFTIHLHDAKVTYDRKKIEVLGLIDFHLQHQRMTLTRRVSGNSSSVETMVSRDSYEEYQLLVRSGLSLSYLFLPYEQVFLQSIRWCQNLQRSYDPYQALFYLHQIDC